MKRRDLGQRDASGSQFLQHRFCKHGAGDQRVHDSGLLAGMEAAVALGQRHTDGRVIELSESTHGDGVEETHAQQLFANRTQIRRAALDEGL